MGLEEEAARILEGRRLEAARKLAQKRADEEQSEAEVAELAAVFQRNEIATARFFERVGWRVASRRGWIIWKWTPGRPGNSREEDPGAPEEPGIAITVEGVARFYVVTTFRCRLLLPKVPVLKHSDLRGVAMDVLSGRYPLDD